MDALETAKTIEQEGRQYYLKLASESPEPALAGVFNFLAKEEQRHYDIFVALQKRTRPVLEPGTAVAEAKKMFSGLTSHFALPEQFYDYTAAYARALEFEKKTVELYDGMLGAASSDEEKKVLRFLVAEEQRHEHLMEHMIDFVNQPNVFLETAEFNHLDEE